MQATEIFQITDNEAGLQLNADGSLRHLLTLKGLHKTMLIELLDESQKFISPFGAMPARSRTLEGRTVANLFFEPSTRTRASFDLAAKRLGADVLNLDVNTSSRKKGESILDMIYTLQAMHVDIMVIRDASASVPAYIARHVNDYVSILNAGEADGFADHPPAQGRVQGPDGGDCWRHRAFTRGSIDGARAKHTWCRRVAARFSSGTGTRPE